jgi:hypothetical protein
MAQPNRRSQALLRLPVDQVSATMILHDGSRSDVELFLTGGETIEQVLGDGAAFLPVIRKGNVALVARTAIACLSVVETRITSESELPAVTQRAHVHLNSGVVLEGELEWTAVAGRQRTADHLNDPSPLVALYDAGVTHHVVKAHVAIVEEKGAVK